MLKVKNAATSPAVFSSCGEPLQLTEVPAFTPVLSECIHFLDSLPVAQSLAAGTLLVEQGRPANTVYLIESGLAKLVHVNASGREVILGLRSEGWYAGYTGALLKTPHAYSVRAVTACKVARIPAEEFSRRLHQNSEMLTHFLSVLCLEVASQANLQVEVMSSSAQDRLDHFMGERMAHYLSTRTLDPLPALKQMELAQLLAVTPEHLSRMMKKKKTASDRRAAMAAGPVVSKSASEKPYELSGAVALRFASPSKN